MELISFGYFYYSLMNSLFYKDIILILSIRLSSINNYMYLLFLLLYVILIIIYKR